MLVVTKPPGVLIVLYCIETRRQNDFLLIPFCVKVAYAIHGIRRFFFEQAKQLASLRSLKAIEMFLNRNAHTPLRV